jgi:hypothetical protein
MQGNIADLRNSSKVSSVQRGVSCDWTVITETADGPTPNPAEVFADHADGYQVVSQLTTDSETFVHINEVSDR